MPMTELRTRNDEVKNNTVFPDEIRYKIEVQKNYFFGITINNLYI